MALQPSLKKIETVRWDFSEPLANASSDSPVFLFMDIRWMLKYSLNFCFGDDKYYSINLINCDGTKSFMPFEVTSILENRENGCQQLCSHLTITTPYNCLWVGSRTKTEKKLGFSGLENQEFSIICVFLPPKSLPSDAVKTIDDSTAKCSDDRIAGYTLLLDPKSCNPDESLTSLKPLSSLENLSEDMGGMFKQGLMPDLELKCEEAIIPVHKAILAARCREFAAMCENKMVNNENGTVEINDIMPSTLQQFLKFLYSGKVSGDLPAEIASQLYSFSYRYPVRSLQKECTYLMARNLNDENFIESFTTAEVFGDQLLKGAIADFIAGRPLLMKCDTWAKFSAKCPNLANEIYRNYVEKSLGQKEH